MVQTTEKLKDLDENGNAKAKPLHRGVIIGSVAVFISVLGAAVTFPFLQSQRDLFECNAECYGFMQSLRSGLTLIGTIFVGRMSDRFGRRFALWVGVGASLATCVLNYRMTTMQEMWIAMIPSSLLNQNYTVLKALFADYNAEIKGSEADRASAMGKLGMAVGISFMLGPSIGAVLLSTYKEACLVAGGLTIASAGMMLFLPHPKLKRIDSDANLPDLVADTDKTSLFKRVFKFLYLPAAQSHGARLLMVIRLLMGLAFNIFMTIWTVSLKQRFEFGPRDHAFFMGWIGLCYALSQGVVAQYFIKLAGSNPTNLLCACAVSLSAGRVMAMLTNSLAAVYVIMAAVIIALGIMNTAMTSAVTKLADADQIGGLMGVMEAIENCAGLVGPGLGGILFRTGSYVPISAVVSCYLLVFALIKLYYKRHIVEHRRVYPTKYKESDGKDSVWKDSTDSTDSTSSGKMKVQ
jgi:MFS family permease